MSSAPHNSLKFDDLKNFFLKKEHWPITQEFHGVAISRARFSCPEDPGVYFEVSYLQKTARQPDKWICAVEDSSGNFYEIAELESRLVDYWKMYDLLATLRDQSKRFAPGRFARCELGG